MFTTSKNGECCIITGQYPKSSSSMNFPTLLFQLEKEYIFLDAEYQRNEDAWNERQKSDLINTFVKGYTVLPVVFSMNTKTGIKTSIDGKQRMTAIRDFVDNKFPWSVDGNRFWFSDVPKGKKGAIFSENSRILFMTNSISYDCYNDMSDDDQRELFEFIQKGSKLKTGEKLVALPCEAARVIDRLRKFYPKNYLSDDFVRRKEPAVALARAIIILDEIKSEQSIITKRDVWHTKNVLEWTRQATITTKVEKGIERALKYFPDCMKEKENGRGKSPLSSYIIVILYLNRRELYKLDSKARRQKVIELREVVENIVGNHRDISASRCIKEFCEAMKQKNRN